MKKGIVLITLCVLMVFAAELHAGGFWRNLGRAVKASLPQVTFPAVRNVAGVNVGVSANGVQVAGNNMVVRNGTPIPGITEIFVYGKSVAILKPGDIAYDNRHVELLTPQIPILARFIDEKGNFIGFARNKFYISGNYPTSNSWTIQPENIAKPDGQYLWRSYGDSPISPYPTTQLESTKVQFPRKWWNATAGVQIGNGNNFTLAVAENGGGTVRLAPGDVVYIEDKLISGFGFGLTRSLQLTWLDGGRLIQARDVQFTVPSNGVYAYQVIAGPPGSYSLY